MGVKAVTLALVALVTAAVLAAAAGGSPNPAYSVSPNYKTLIDRYFADVAAASGQTTNVYSVETQYYDGTGPIAYNSTFGGSVIATNPFPASGCPIGYTPGLTDCLTDTQIIAEINLVIGQQGWVKNDTTQFFLYTPKNVGSCFGPSPSSGCAYTDYCAYHGYAGGLIYANQPYAAHAGCDTGERPNGDDADPTINVMSHEHREAINDFQLNAWYDDQGFEGSDKCAWDFGGPILGPPGGHYNQVINGHNYYLQQEWSNDGSTCLLQYGGGPLPPKGPAAAAATPTGPVHGGLVPPIGARAEQGGGDLIYHGGPVMRTNKTYAIYWIPAATTAPTITSFSPTSGPVGTTVQINGTKFSGATSVKFNGVSATQFLVYSSTLVLAKVPTGATTGPISVTTPGGTGQSATSFTVGGGGGPPIVSSFTPASGPVGTVVTVNGSRFTGVTSVKFNGVSAQFLVSSSTKLYAKVPSGATTGKISVTNGSGTGTSATNFTVS
jgi:hypothetical protein